MKCIIMGAGKVGYSIAAILVKGNHDVTVIDISEERLNVVQQSLDVQAVVGNGAHYATLHQAGVEDADLLVAVTKEDEFNMVACFFAKTLGVKSTVARVRDPGYGSFSDRQKQMGIDLIINPEKVSAEEVLKLIHFPEARNVKFFADNRVQMMELEIKETVSVVGKTLQEITFPKPCVVVGIVRDEEVIVPHGRDRIEAGDIVFVLSATGNMADISEFLGVSHRNAKDVVIFGGGIQTYYLAEMLDREKYTVKIVENDMDLCDDLAEKLNHCLVINGSVTDLQLLEDENVGEMDVCVALTDDDKENLLVSILAKQLGAQKTVAQIRRSDYIPMLEKVGIDRAISPRSLTAAAIIRFINKSYLRDISFLQGEHLQIAELVVPKNAKVAGKQLKELRFPRYAIIGVISRGDEVIIPGGNDYIYAGDRIILMALESVINDANEYLVKC